MSSVDTAPFPAVAVDTSTAEATPAPHPESRGHSPATLHQAGPMIKAHREIGNLLNARAEILPGLHRTVVDDDGTMAFHYAGAVGSETTSSWTSPDGLLSTWRALLSSVSEREEYVERTVEVDGRADYVQDRHITVIGTHDGLRVRVLLTAAGLLSRRAS